MEASRRQPKSSVWMKGGDDSAWCIAETPSEVHEMVRQAESSGDRFVELTLANESEWNGRSTFIDHTEISAVSPPMKRGDEDEE